MHFYRYAGVLSVTLKANFWWRQNEAHETSVNDDVQKDHLIKIDIKSTAHSVAKQSSGAVWKSRWPSWVPVPNKPTVSADVKQRFNQSRKAFTADRVLLTWSKHTRSLAYEG